MNVIIMVAFDAFLSYCFGIKIRHTSYACFFIKSRLGIMKYSLKKEKKVSEIGEEQPQGYLRSMEMINGYMYVLDPHGFHFARIQRQTYTK